ncbi:hypothetical protein HYC85_023134 [Camellia sinensis]|uniref:Major facilitator superfamily (MFS) profile domain-containing protein n=1 Tax=Camellia sinensis TaxID=4442 RepID=A0A7J7GEV3_CAMSI|nr:hypothetical protein HYC85_023134 [Camellia sinensis]
MESAGYSDEKKMATQPLLGTTPTQKGGLRTMPFIIANEAFEKLASYGLMPNMIMYLMNEYDMDMPTGSNILFLWSAATNFMPVLGAVMADSSVGRFRMIGFGSIVSFLGMILLWLTTMIPQARPPSCDQSSYNCTSATPLQLILLCSSFGLMSIGAGGIRSSSLAFGADQLAKHENLEILLCLTELFQLVLCYSRIFRWQVGFGVPAMLMFLSSVSFFLASPFYVKVKVKSSLVVGFFQVIVGSYKNRHFELSSQSSNMSYYHKKGSMLVVPSENLRFLNKACIIRDPQQDSSPDGRTSDRWICTVDQVEELKSLSMDRHITSNFEIPAGSFGMFLVISLTLWIALYDRVILPIASKVMGKPAYLSPKQRMVAAIVERIRRAKAIEEGYSDNSHAVVNMSALWLVPQYFLSGLAEAFNGIGQNEFYFSELPGSMSSIATTLNGVGMSIANLLASAIMNTINDVTGRGGNESWVSSNINKAHFDYYYWVLAGHMVLVWEKGISCKLLPPQDPFQ